VTHHTDQNEKQLNDRLARMDDRALLQYGTAAKFMCSKKAKTRKTHRRGYVVKLRLARAEWRRRHPKLPFIKMRHTRLSDIRQF
jgi:hypothetical protein